MSFFLLQSFPLVERSTVALKKYLITFAFYSLPSNQGKAAEMCTHYRVVCVISTVHIRFV